MPRVSLPMLCPSNGSVARIDVEPCVGASCSWWRRGSGCSAHGETELALRGLLPDAPGPPCPIADRCEWHRQGVASGAKSCLVVRSGDLCEHQPGGEFNVFVYESSGAEVGRDA